MRRILIILSLLFATPSYAADTTVTAMTAAGAIGGTELLYCVQAGADRKCTPAQLSTYIQSLISGDCVIAANVITCAKVNGVNFPASFTSGGIPYASSSSAISSSAALGANLPVIGGGAGVAPSTGTRSGNTTAFATVTGTLTSGRCVEIDGSGNFVQSAAACGGSVSGANPTGTAGPTAVNGVALTFMRSDGAPAIQQGSNTIKGIVQVDGTTITASSGVISAVGGSGTVTNIATTCGIAGGAITTTGTLTGSITTNPQTGTNYPIVTGDCGSLINLSNAAPQIPTIAQAGSAGFLTGWYTSVCNQGAGTQTITPTTSTIGGAATYVLAAGTAAAPKCVGIVSDGTNYQVVPTTGSTTDASLLTSGTLAAGRLPALTGDVTSSAGSAATTLAAGSASNLNSGTLAAARMPALTGDCVTAVGTVATTCNYNATPLVATRWYYPGPAVNQTSSSALGLNVIRCVYGYVPQRVTISQLGLRSSTAGTNVQLAIYAMGTDGLPAALISNTGNIDVSGAAGGKTGALLANKQVGPGGTDGGADLFWCFNGDNSAFVGAGIAVSNTVLAVNVGGTSGSIFTAASGAMSLTCSGAACAGGSSTFNTWPGTLAGTTWTFPAGSVSAPLVGYLVNSVP